MTNNLTIPITEIEKAELLSACQQVIKPNGILLLRRALYELDKLKNEITTLRAERDTLKAPDPQELLRATLNARTIEADLAFESEQKFKQQLIVAQFELATLQAERDTLTDYCRIHEQNAKNAAIVIMRYECELAEARAQIKELELELELEKEPHHD